MDIICRGCLDTFDDLNNIYEYTEKLRRQFVYATGIQVKQNDAFKFQLCKECICALQASCKFKKKCRTSDKIFKNYMMMEESEHTSFSLFLNNLENRQDKNLINGKNEDDNASTSPSASIVNFMKDILDEDELVSAESKIINEVVQEDMDILDDSLDSHWLQDNVSVDFNFQGDRCLPVKDLWNVTKTDVLMKAITTLKEENTRKCRIDSNLQKAINSNKEKCLLEQLLLTPSVTSTPKAASISSELDRIMRSIGPKDCLGGDIQKSGGKNRAIMEKIRRKNLELSSNSLKSDSESFQAVDDTKSVSTQGPISVTGELERIIKGLKEIQPENDKMTKIEDILNEETAPKNNGKDINMFKEVVDKNDEELVFDRNDTLDEAKDDLNMEEEENQSIKGYETVNYIHRHGDPWNCEICKTVESTQKNLEHHYSKAHRIDLIVTRKYGEKSYVCKVCGKISSHPSNAKRHELTHKKEKNKTWKCSMCDVEFTAKRNLTLHMSSHEEKISNKSKEKDSKIYKFVCTQCGYRASTKSNLNVHVRRHGNNYKFSCDECQKGFYKKSDLTYHMRLHTGEMPYKCNKCPAKFNRSDHLTQHSRKHTGERPYICDVCYSTYPSLTHLRYHKLRLCLGRPNPGAAENMDLTTIPESPKVDDEANNLPKIVNEEANNSPNIVDEELNNSPKIVDDELNNSLDVVDEEIIVT